MNCYSVFNPRGEKIADCGSLRDATTLVGMRNAKWDGHYYQFKPTYQTIDVTSNQLPPNQKYIGWQDVTSEKFDDEFVSLERQQIPLKQLPTNNQEPLNL